MIKKICNRIELIHESDIRKMDTNGISIATGKSFTNLNLEGKAIYQSQEQITGAGIVINETVTAKIKDSESLPFLKLPLKNYVLRLHSDQGAFIVGSKDYPCELSSSTDKIFVNLTFKASKPK